MNRYILTTIPLILLLTTTACTVTGTTSTPITSSVVSTPKFPEKSTETPDVQTVPTKSTVNNLTSSCSLLNSRDLASFFPSHTEVILPTPQTDRVDHPVFSIGKAAGTETACVFYAFHLPGSSAEIMLQVNYWADVPFPTTSNKAWMQEWTQAKSEADHLITGIGSDAFFKDGRLSFNKGDLYITIAATETDLDLKSPSGMNKQISIEKQIALDMLDRLG